MVAKDSASTVTKVKDNLSLEGMDHDLIVHRFAVPTSAASSDLFGYTMVLNKFNTIKDHVSLLFKSSYLLVFKILRLFTCANRL